MGPSRSVAALVLSLIAVASLARADVFVMQESRDIDGYDSNGAFVGEISLPDLPNAYSDPGASAMAVGPDGNLYVAVNQTLEIIQPFPNPPLYPNNGYVIKYDPHTYMQIGGYVVPPTSAGVSGIAFGPDGNLYVVVGNDIDKYNPQTGTFLGVFAAGAGVGAIAFGPDGNLYGLSNNGVLKFNGSTGANLGYFIAANTFSFPVDLTFGPDGNLYVSDWLGGLGVLKYNGSTGAFITTVAPNGSANMEASFGIRFGQDGNIYVVDDFTGNVQVFSTAGAFIKTFTVSGVSATLIAITPVSPTNAIQVRYFSDLNDGDSYIDITNDSSAGNLCANIYTFAPDEQMISCCACLVTPNALNSLSVKQDLISNVLTGAMPNSVTVRIVTSAPIGNVCSPADVSGGSLSAGISAWGTTLHAAGSPGAYQLTETPFTFVNLGALDPSGDASECGFIAILGSGAGLCKSCRMGTLGGAKQ